MSDIEHGTLTGYKIQHCHCDLCEEANRAYVARRSRLKAYGQWEPYVDAEPARQHVKMLGEMGIGWKQVARLAGVSTGGMSKLVYGDAPRGMGPSKRIRPETAEKILCVQPSVDLLADGAMVEASGTRRRLQALVAVGWAQSRLAERLGVERTNFNRTIRSGMVRAGTARAVCRLYDELWNQPPPESGHREKISAARARNYAREFGWPPPLAWDEEFLDLPDADLEVELARRAAAMDDGELRACHNARFKLHDPSPLIKAGAAEYTRRKTERRKQAAA